MKFKTLNQALASITTTTDAAHGTRYICELGSFNGQRRRIVRGRLDLCESAVREFYATIGQSGDAKLALSPQQVSDAACAYSLLRQHGITDPIYVIVNRYLEAKAKNDSVPYDLADAYDEYLAHYSHEQKVQRHFVEQRVGKFCGWMMRNTRNGVKCHQVCSLDVTGYLGQLNSPAPRTYNGTLSYISSFFEWCRKSCRKYVVSNPCEGIDFKPVSADEPEIATVRAVEAIFNQLDSDTAGEDLYACAKRAALSFFCGMRTAEIARIGPEDILQDGTVIVRRPKGFTKGVHPRVFKAPDTARAWLDCIPASIAPAGDTLYRRMVSCALKNYKVPQSEVPRNAGRHTFITYDLAKRGLPESTAGMCGTSVGVIKKHYQSVSVSVTDAEEYFSIRPKSMSVARALFGS